MDRLFSNGGQRQELGLRDLYVVAASGGTPRKFADTPDRNARSFEWSRDSKVIFTIESVHTARQILAVPVDGEKPRMITKGDGVFGSFSLSQNGERMAFAYQNLDTAADVYTTPLKMFGFSKVTDLHKDVLKPAMGRTEIISWKSKDGLEIEGLLTYPVNYERGRKYPLILNIHGGPAGVYTQSFTGNPSIYMIQYFLVMLIC